MLNRIMLITAVVVCSISAAGTLLGSNIIFIALALLLLLAVVCLAFRKRKFAKSFAVVIPVAMLFCIPLYTTLSNISEAEALVGIKAEITGYVCEEPQYNDGYTVFTVKTTSVNLEGAPQSLKFRITVFNNTDIKEFDIVKAKVKFTSAAKNRALSYLADEIYILAEFDSLVATGETYQTVYKYAVRARQSIRSKIDSHLGYEEAAIVRGIMLGDTYNIPRPLYNALKSCGLSHIVAVSGLHLSIICYSLLRILKKLRIPNRISTVITALAVVMIMAITGFTPSIMRSAFMFLLVLLGRFFYNDIDILNLLGCSVVINIFLNPMIILNAGFLLSVLSTAGIVTIVSWVEERIKRKIDITKPLGRIASYCIISVAQCGAAIFATLPVICGYIGYFSVIAPIVTLLVMYPATLILTLSVLGVLFSFLGITFFSYPLFLASGLLTKLFIFIVKSFAALPITTTRIGDREALLCTFACVLLFAILACNFPNRRTIKLAAACVCLIFAVNICVNAILASRRSMAYILSTESGQSAAVISHQGRMAVICPDLSYNEFALLGEIISDEGGVIDLLIIPETENDMRKETNYFLNNFEVNSILFANSKYIDAYSSLKGDIIISNLQSAEIDLWGKYTLISLLQQNGDCFVIDGANADISIIHPKNNDYIIPNEALGQYVVVMGYPYTEKLPASLKDSISILVDKTGVNANVTEFYKNSQSVVVMNNGDVISFSLNTQPQIE